MTDRTERVVNPAVDYRHPMEVVYHAGLSPQAKLRILSRWAAASSAAPGAPLMRRDPSTGSIAHLDGLVAALQALDEETTRRARSADLRPRVSIQRDDPRRAKSVRDRYPAGRLAASSLRPTEIPVSGADEPVAPASALAAKA